MKKLLPLLVSIALSFVFITPAVTIAASTDSGVTAAGTAQPAATDPQPLPGFITPTAPDNQPPTINCTGSTCDVTPSPTAGNNPGSGNSGSSGSGFTQPDLSGLTGISNSVVAFINDALVPLLIAVAFIVFLYGVANAYIINGASEEKRTEGHRFILWGIIGFVVIFSLWGLVNLVQGTFNFSSSQTHPNYPTL